MNKIILLFLPLFLYSKCTYNIDVNFDFKNKSLTSTANIIDSSKSIQINLDNFDIKNETNLIEQLDNGSNNITFTYKKQDENINEKFIYLLNDWYPQVKGLCSYNIHTNLSTDYKKIYEKTNKEIDKVTFIASKDYNVNSEMYNNIKISTYFFNNDKELSKRYLNKTIEYIKLYEKIIGNFPYKVFNVVENIAITGYSMPTYTLVGSYLLYKDYLLNRSLGHEILHQYFGNSIFNDNKKGNYSEGLVTHLADNYYEKLKNNDLITRKLNLLSYDNFVKQEFAPKNFVFRKDRSSMAIGYTKIAYIFYMLEDKIGTDKFNQIIKKLYKERKFQEVNLHELREYIQNNTEEDLKEFFEQWFDKGGKINFEVKDMKKEYDRNGFKISFLITQKELYKFTLPLYIKTFDTEFTKDIEINQKDQKVSFYLKSEPLEITFDKEYKLFRNLFLDEYPLNIGRLISTPNLLIVMDKKFETKFENILRAFPNGKIVYKEDVKFEDLKKSSVIFLDKNNDMLKYFFPRLSISDKNSFLSLKKHTYNKNEQMAILHVNEKINRSFYMLKHYANYKYIYIEGKKVNKIADKVQNGYLHEFSSKPIISIVEKPTTLDEITKEINDAKIVYVGEAHTNFSHHLNQLRIIKALHEDGKKVAIGMEMFQTPFQKDIDKYLKGESTLNEFLKDSQYYKRWKFDYNYYKPIVDFAKENNIPIIALNISRDIIKEVAKNGILAYKDKSALPKKIDQSNIDYKDDLMNVYSQHNFTSNHTNNENKDTKKDIKKETTENQLKKDYFFQSQLIWDEIMAQNIVEFMKNNNSYTFVVVAGNGHIEKHQGIPYRVHQDNELPYRVIVNDRPSGLINDIVIINRNEVKIPESLKIGILLGGENQLKVNNILEDSVGEKMGLKKDDLLIGLNNKELKDLSDLKRMLYFLDNFDKTVLTVKRDGALIELKYK